MTVYTGPTKLPCPQSCGIPDGARVAIVPTPRHNWADVVHCPNDDCGRSLLVLADGQNAPAEVKA